MAIKNKDVWELLPWDIQVDILSRLSTKDLLELQSVCKDWQSIIESPRFHMFQINANPNQQAICMHVSYSTNHEKNFQIQSLSSNEIYKSDVPMGLYGYTWLLATSNGLVLVLVYKDTNNNQLLVFNPMTKQCIELPELSNLPYGMRYLACDFFEHDLQSSTYKIFFSWKSNVYIYNSSSQTWQSLGSISNLVSHYPFSCVTYKNDIYIAICTLDKKLMMVVYNPILDLWNNFDTNIESNDDNGRLIIANGRLFYAQVNYNRTMINYTISIFEMEIKDKLLIPIIQIIGPFDILTELGCHPIYTKRIFGFGNKITIMRYKKSITYNVCTHEQEEIRNNIVNHCDGIHPYNCTLVSPKHRQI